MTSAMEWVVSGCNAPAQLVIVPGLETSLDSEIKAALLQLGHQHPQLRIGVFTYPNTLRDYATDPSLNIPSQIDVCAVTLRDILHDKPSAVLIGHCLGGLILTSAFAKIPENLASGAKLVLLDTVADTPENGINDWLRGLLAHLRIPETCLENNAKWLQSELGQRASIIAVRTQSDIWISQMRPDAFRHETQQCVVSADHDGLLLSVLQRKATPFDLRLLLNKAGIPTKLK